MNSASTPAPRASRTIEIVRFSRAVYDLDTIKRAAYRFLDRFVVDFMVEDEDIVCRLAFTDIPPLTIETIVDDFRREVLDQDLRRTVAAETSAVRSAILALAFAPVTQSRE